MKADLAAIQRGLCNKDQERKCREETGDNLIEWTCSRCEKKKAEQLSEYTAKMFRLRRLKKAGCPFEPNSLTLEEWMDLGMVEEMMQQWETKTP